MQLKRINLSICAICCFAIWPQIGSGHDLEDGFVERAVQARIRDGQLTIEYAIGLTEPTMLTLLNTSEDGEEKLDNSESAGSNIRERFQRSCAVQVPENLKLKINGQSQKWSVESIAEYPKHHYDFVITLTCELSRFDEIELLVRDMNFMKLEGSARYALKSSGNSIISSSNVAPIIVRAKRMQLDGLKPDERHNSCKIKATIAEMDIKAKD